VVEFHDIIGLEDQVASVATSLLTLEQLSDSGRDERGLPAPGGPVEPIAIIGTARSLHFGKAPDRRVRMICQLNPGILLDASRKDPLSVAEGMPVLAVHPSPVLGAGHLLQRKIVLRREPAVQVSTTMGKDLRDALSFSGSTCNLGALINLFDPRLDIARANRPSLGLVVAVVRNALSMPF
jgi:hypothetical protein